MGTSDAVSEDSSSEMETCASVIVCLSSSFSRRSTSSGLSDSVSALEGTMRRSGRPAGANSNKEVS